MAFSRDEILARIQAAGVVGAGGAGFPTARKYGAPLETLVLNGAECEPLLWKDKEIMRLHAAEIVAAIEYLQAAGMIKNAVIGLKAKAKDAIKALEAAIAGKSTIRLEKLGNFYPSGDEIILIHEALGVAVPHRQLPSYNGIVVNNVETFLWIFRALQGEAVTEKYVSICGEVNEPVTLKVPLGVSLHELLPLAGGVTAKDPVYLRSGAMMGKYDDNFADPVLKTTAGWIILERDHPLVQRHRQQKEQFLRIGHSACDQCSYCTEFCPRYLMGHKVQPHKVMRALMFSYGDSSETSKWASGCVECGVCGLFACPEDLSPHRICGHYKQLLRRDNQMIAADTETTPHPMGEYRKLSVVRLLKKLHLTAYDVHSPYKDVSVVPERVTIPLQQNLGTPSVSAVTPGTPVRRGQIIATEGQGMSATLASSIDGVVESVDNTQIVIRRS